METLQNEEMKRIKGGGISVWVMVGIGAAIVFLSGIIDGFVHPEAC